VRVVLKVKESLERKIQTRRLEKKKEKMIATKMMILMVKKRKKMETARMELQVLIELISLKILTMV
jgi:hypothetical protein